MSAKLLGLAFDVITPSCVSKLVLLKLVDACDDDGTRIFPGVATIARKAQCSERQVQRELKRFLAIKLLVLVSPGGRGPGDTSEYRLDVAVMTQISLQGWPPEEDESAEKADTVSPLATMGDSEAPKGDISADKGDTRSHPTPPLDPSIDPEREARARAEKAPPAPPPAAGLTIDQAWAALRLCWPEFALANEDLVRRALSGLTSSECKLAVDRVPVFLAFHRERQGKNRLPPLHVYVGQKHHWDALPKAAKAAVGAGEHRFVGSFDRAWWWLYFDAVRRFGIALLDGRSNESAWLRRKVSAARTGIGWKVAGGRIAEIEAAALRLVPVPVDGPEFVAWVAAMRAQGVELPRPDKAGCIYAPSLLPPDERERDAALREEAAGIMGVER